MTRPVVPIRVGVLGLVASGLLFEPMGSPITIHATVAIGDEGTRFRFGSGYGF